MNVLKIVSVATLLGFASLAMAQTAPGLTVSVTAPASVATGNARTLATVTLTAGSSDVVLTKLPLSMGYAAQTGIITSAVPLTNCKLQQAGGAAINTGSNAITSAVGSQDIMVNFDQALSIAANGSATLSFVCDVPATVPNGSAVATAIFPASVSAQTTGGAAIAVGGVNLGTTGAAMGVTIISSATTGTPDTGGTPPVGGTPGVPNTGAGGNTGLTLLTIIVSGLVAFAAGAYTYRLRRA